MTTSTVKNLLRAALAVVMACATPALAEYDSVGLGNGSDGELTVRDGEQNKVINRYENVKAELRPGATVIPVSDAKGFAPDDLVMVLQTTGSGHEQFAAENSRVKLAGTGVGLWEFARVLKVDGTTLHLSAPLVHGYAGGSSTQVIRVPEYTSVTIQMGGSLSPQPWDGARGGVLAFLVQGTLTTNAFSAFRYSTPSASINATGMGFQGGRFEMDGTSTPACLAEDEAHLKGGQRGLGIGIVKGVAPAWGRDRALNGGGGGLCFKAGGGGGGNGGCGGNGGNSAEGDRTLVGGRPVGGEGGAVLDFTPGERLLMGGGGGAGHMTDSAAGGGGAGGGIIFIRAHDMTGTGLIEANGANGGGSTSADSGSGGGAGGTLYLRIAGPAECRPPRVQGGKGGDAALRTGPGGGGGGGRIFFQKGSGACKLDADSVLGVNPGTQSDPTDASHGATAGGNGSVTEVKGVFPVQALPAPVLQTPANGQHLHDSTPVYSGTVGVTPAVTPGTQVYVIVDNREVGSAPIGNDGTWTLHPTGPEAELGPGPHTVYAVVRDDEQGVASVASDTNTFTVDVLAPKVTVTAPTKDSKTDDSTPDFTGTVSDDGPGPLTVTVRVDDNAEAPAQVTDGTWSYTPTVPLAPGPHTVTVVVTDPAGNSATDSTPFTVDPSVGSGSGTGSNKPGEPGSVERNLLGGGVGCAASGGAPSALAMMGLAVLGALRMRRRQR